MYVNSHLQMLALCLIYEIRSRGTGLLNLGF